MTKVDRNGNAVQVLNNICSILDTRYESHDSVDDAIVLLNSSFLSKKNNDAVNAVKKIIEETINALADCVDSLDYEGMEDCLSILYKTPSNLHKSAYYYLNQLS